MEKSRGAACTQSKNGRHSASGSSGFIPWQTKESLSVLSLPMPACSPQCGLARLVA